MNPGDICNGSLSKNDLPVSVDSRFLAYFFNRFDQDFLQLS